MAGKHSSGPWLTTCWCGQQEMLHSGKSRPRSPTARPLVPTPVALHRQQQGPGAKVTEGLGQAPNIALTTFFMNPWSPVKRIFKNQGSRFLSLSSNLVCQVHPILGVCNALDCGHLE